MPQHCCTGAVMNCTFGAAPSTLNVLPKNKMMTSNMAAANIMDNIPNVNIPPFGVCKNLANPTVPASLDRPNEGDGDNFDSLGVFQQRPSQGWGTVAQLMNPRYAANAFYERLVEIADWEERSLGGAAQAVQRSGVPDGYDKHEERAGRIVDALL